MITVVTTQAELDAALAKNVGPTDWHDIEIRSEKGVWIEISRAYDSATVRAYGSATVRATGSATVTAYESATVRATGSATVTAYDSATVTATSKVAVHLHSASVKVQGGVVIDVSKPIKDAVEWCDYYGVEVTEVDGTQVATVFKAVNDEWTTDRGFDYSPGSTPSAPDWRDRDDCGGGLHFGPTPVHAEAYNDDATRYVACGVALDTLRVITGGTAKCKAPAVIVPCREVDIDGRGVTA